MAMTITPVVAKIHYDDLARKYAIKVTRQTYSVVDGYKFEELIDDAVTLLELINLLYQLWAIVASPGGAVRNAPDEDLAAHQAWLAGQTVATSEFLAAGSEAGPGTAPTADEWPTYDGSSDSWGEPPDH